jgi:hypothetical protein
MEYRSQAQLLGLPLVHVATSAIVDGRLRRGVAIGWIAVGDVAVGVLLACGGISVGAISVGGAAVGLLPLGGLALGALALGGIAVGVVAMGGAAIAWYAAVGGLAIAHDYAAGGLAIAQHVIAPQRGSASPFASIQHAPFHWSEALLLIAIAVALLIVALTFQGRRKE